MSNLKDRIAQFTKMTTDDPDNELGHFRLGQLLQEDGQADRAADAFRRTVEISPEFSKAYQLLAECLIKLDRKDEAGDVLTKGFEVAHQRGDNMPRDAMAGLLRLVGRPVPQLEAPKAEDDGPADGTPGFKCQRPGCPMGRRARKLAAAPMNDSVGRRVFDSVCVDCWNGWVKDYSIKVINELRLDLITETGQREYDKYMREYLGFEAEDAPESAPAPTIPE